MCWFKPGVDTVKIQLKAEISKKNTYISVKIIHMKTWNIRTNKNFRPVDLSKEIQMVGEFKREPIYRQRMDVCEIHGFLINQVDQSGFFCKLLPHSFLEFRPLFVFFCHALWFYLMLALPCLKKIFFSGGRLWDSRFNQLERRTFVR